eukprot:684849-Hanusia_phi.AAC.1
MEACSFSARGTPLTRCGEGSAFEISPRPPCPSDSENTMSRSILGGEGGIFKERLASASDRTFAASQLPNRTRLLKKETSQAWSRSLTARDRVSLSLTENTRSSDSIAFRLSCTAAND